MNNKQRGKGTEGTKMEKGSVLNGVVVDDLAEAIRSADDWHGLYTRFSYARDSVVAFVSPRGKGDRRSVGTDDKGNISTGIL